MKASPSAIAEHITRRRVVPVAVLDSVEDAVPLARALTQGGLPVIEITLRTPCALDCIRAIRQNCPDTIVGAGTILEASQVKAAIAAGAQFGVSPGLTREVVQAALRQQLLFIPGVMTPSEIEAAMALDCRLLKFFPAEAAGGVKRSRPWPALTKRPGCASSPWAAFRRPTWQITSRCRSSLPSAAPGCANASWCASRSGRNWQP